MKRANSVIPIVTAGWLFTISLAYAAVTVPPPTGLQGNLPLTVTKTTDIENIAQGAANWTFWGLIVLSVIMFLVGGYRYVTSGGEPEKVRSANKTLLFAAIAVVVALLAAGMPLIIGSLFGQGGTFLAPL